MLWNGVCNFKMKMSSMKSCKICLALLLVLHALDTTKASAINLTMTPPDIQTLLTQTMTLRCRLFDTGSSDAIGKRDVTNTTDNIRFVTSAIVTRDGMDVASMSEHIPVKALADLDNVHVTGEIDNTPGDRGYLEVTWDYPTAQQGGRYTCTVHGVDDGGHHVTFSSSVDVDVVDPTTKTLAEYIHKLQVRDKAHEKAHNETVEYIQTTNKNQDANIAGLQKTTQEQEQKLSQLTAKIAALEKVNQDQAQKNNQMEADLQESKHIESGVISCGDVDTWDTGVTYIGGYSYRYKYVSDYFSRSYKTAPVVQIGTVAAMIDYDDYAWFDISVYSTYTNRFTIRCAVRDYLRNQDLHELKLHWVSIPQ